MQQNLLHNSRVKKLVIFISAIICVVLLRNFWQTWQRLPTDTVETVSLEQMEKQKQDLLEEIEADKSSLNQEQTIRNELNMQKVGETILQLPPLPTSTPNLPTSPTPTQKPIQAWKQLLF